MNILFYVGLLLLAGLLGAKAIRLAKLPAVTGYLLAGLLIGPYLGRIIPLEAVETINFLSNIALGFIAFSIGAEFKASYFKRVGITPIIIAIFEALGAVILVTGALILCGFEIPFAIMLGAIAAATAPAATIMVIKQYRAKGEVTETLLSVVALDDAVALIAFALATAVAQSMLNGGGNILLSLVDPLLEIVESLGAGALMSVIFMFIMKYFKTSANRLSLVVAFILLCTGIAETFALSELLMCMAFGAVFANLYNDSETIMRITDEFTPPLLMIFFVLSGSELNIAILPQIGLVGVIYIVVRVIGKVLGAMLGAKVSHASKNITEWLGWALLPQAGVAIGLSLVAQSVVPGKLGSTIRAVILCATLVYELFGPAVTKWALTRAGEISPSAQ